MHVCVTQIEVLEMLWTAQLSESVKECTHGLTMGHVYEHDLCVAHLSRTQIPSQIHTKMLVCKMFTQTPAHTHTGVAKVTVC